MDRFIGERISEPFETFPDLKSSMDRFIVNPADVDPTSSLFKIQYG